MLQLFRKKYTIPNKLDISLLGRGNGPKDIWKLEQKEWQLLFVPDVLMRRHHYHNVIQPYIRNGLPEYSGFTAEDCWSFWKHKLGKESYGIPMINQFASGNLFKHNAIGRIKGELVAIRSFMFRDLDSHYNNGKEYIRFRTNIIIPYRRKSITQTGEFLSPEFTETIRAWMYVGVPKFWLPQLDGGLRFDPVATFEAVPKEDKWWAGRYFFWSLNEYNHSRTTHTVS